MKKLLLIISISIICSSCGKKDKPEYQAKINYNNSTVYLK